MNTPPELAPAPKPIDEHIHTAADGIANIHGYGGTSTTLNTNYPRKSVPHGAFPTYSAGTNKQKYNKHLTKGHQIAAELERIWGMQQQLGLPHRHLNVQVLSSLQAIRTQAGHIGLGVWVDMLMAIQHGIDHQINDARALAKGIHLDGSTTEDSAHQVTAQIVAYFYIGLLDVSPLRPSDQIDGLNQTTLSQRMDQHRRAQAPTWEALQQLRQTGLKPPAELAPLVTLIAVFINAMHGMPDPPEGHLHMLIPATMDSHHSSECLHAYALAQICKNRHDRAVLTLRVCKDSALRRGLRVHAVLALSDLIHVPSTPEVWVSTWCLAKDRSKILEHWSDQDPGISAPVSETIPDTPRRADRIQLALAFISSHIDTKFTTSEMANVCGVSARTMSDDFRAVFHKTVLAYVTQERMRVALVLLQDPLLSLDTIAAKVGFHSTLGFTKAFFRTYGHLPQRPPPL